jgi:hypothetical protein
MFAINGFASSSNAQCDRADTANIGRVQAFLSCKISEDVWK